MSIDLFAPYKIEKLELRNRFMRSATYDGSADADGCATEGSWELFRKLGAQGIGLIVTGHAYVTKLGQAGPGQYGIHDDRVIPGLTKLTRAVHSNGGKVAVQIAHAGINSSFLESSGLTAMAVSESAEANRPHRAMTEEDIESIISAFGKAAERALEAGFDAVQIHGAHGYLVSQFLSPLTNRRTDRWGGSVHNRRRFVLEVVRTVRSVLRGEIPLMIKFGVQDDIEGGLQLEDGIETARQMVIAGVDAIEISGGIGNTTLSKGEAYFRERSSAVKKAVPVPVAEVGGIRRLETAQSIVDSGDADIVSLSRPFIREPGLVKRWQSGDAAPARCVSCSRCMVFPRRGLPLQCGQDNRLPRGTDD